MNTFEENAGRIARSMGEAARQVADPAPVMIGEVVSTSPLKVWADGLNLGLESLWINEALLAGYDPGLSGTLTGTGAMGAVTTKVEPGDLTRRGPALKAGDRVVVLSLDRQIYYILCKAVTP